MLNSVMVVDDESSIRSAVEQWLSLSGFEVQLFSRAEECLAVLPKHFAGVILSDVRMPGSMDGIALLRVVKQTLPTMPVIITSAHLQPTLDGVDGAPDPDGARNPARPRQAARI